MEDIRPPTFIYLMPRFFLQVISLSGVVVMLCSSALLFLALRSDGLFFFLTLSITGLSLYFRYLNLSVVHLSRGKLIAPRFMELVGLRGIDRLLKILLLSGLVIAAFSKTHLLPPPYDTLTEMGMYALIPASFFFLMLDGQYARALNPILFIKRLWICRKDYCLLMGMIYLLHLGMTNAITLLSHWIDERALTFCVLLLGLYLVTIIALVTAYIAYCQHDDLQIPSAKRFEDFVESIDGAPLSIPPPLKMAQDAVIDGRLSDAKAVLAHALRETPDNFFLHARYHRLLTLIDNRDEIRAHAAKFINLLLSHQKEHKAIHWYEQFKTSDPDFQLPSDIESLSMAKMLRHYARPELALFELMDFEQRFPNSVLTAQMLLLRAKTLADARHEEAQAQTILHQIVTLYPGSATAMEAAKCLAALPDPADR